MFFSRLYWRYLVTGHWWSFPYPCLCHTCIQQHQIGEMGIRMYPCFGCAVFMCHHWEQEVCLDDKTWSQFSNLWDCVGLHLSARSVPFSAMALRRMPFSVIQTQRLWGCGVVYFPCFLLLQFSKCVFLKRAPCHIKLEEVFHNMPFLIWVSRLSFQIHKMHSFLDYIMGGCQIQFTVSVFFVFLIGKVVKMETFHNTKYTLYIYLVFGMWDESDTYSVYHVSQCISFN